VDILVIEAPLEAIVTSPTLFVDTTNRIDLALGACTDHLLRLPLRYYERRPVGEAVYLGQRTRKNIRQFLSGIAPDRGSLDAVFPVIYIIVMVFYS